jgi:alpha-methylacyl-CoA racemase
MIFADLGADVVRLDRTGAVDVEERSLYWLVTRNQRSIAVDLKRPEGTAIVLALADAADVLIEGFRPGVAERLGIGPEICFARNPSLIYARATGWGQEGPWAQVPGHDLNYVAVTGVLHAIGRRSAPPAPPLNLLGDYAGGGMMCALGILASLIERSRSGQGQIIDSAMVDGVALLSTIFHGLRHLGMLHEERESNSADGGAPWCDTYECADGRFIAVVAFEPQFFAALCELLDLEGRFDDPSDRSRWPEMRALFASAFARRSRDEWATLTGDPRLCLSPVLTWAEAPTNPQLVARDTFVTVDGVVQPAPAPRFSRTAASTPTTPPWPGQHTDEVLSAWGVIPEIVAKGRTAGAIRQRTTS